MSGHFDQEDLGSVVFDRMVAAMLLPTWAVGLTNDYMALGAQLCTKDGRRVGNAVVIERTDTIGTVYAPHLDYNVPIILDAAVILSDMGNTLTLTLNELKELFHEPRYLIDLNDRRVAARLAELQEGGLTC